MWLYGVFSWLAKNRWAQLVGAGIAFFFTIKSSHALGRYQGHRKGEAKAKEEFDEAIETANTQTEARADRAQQAGNEIDEQIYDDPDRSADSLNAVELRRLTENDPHNHGRRVRDA